MSFANSCFISYKCSEDELTRRFITELAEALNNSTGQLLDGQKAYYDAARLKAGYQFDESLSKEMARSTCMVAVLSPRYFRSEYCYREYIGMQLIEDRRRQATGLPPVDRSIVIPLLFRGEEKDIPAEIKGRVHFMKLRYSLANLKDGLMGDPNLVDAVEELGEIIAEHFNDYGAEKAKLAVACCDGFLLPACPDSGPWPKGKSAGLPFPGRNPRELDQGETK